MPNPLTPITNESNEVVSSRSCHCYIRYLMLPPESLDIQPITAAKPLIRPVQAV